MFAKLFFHDIITSPTNEIKDFKRVPRTLSHDDTLCLGFGNYSHDIIGSYTNSGRFHKKIQIRSHREFFWHISGCGYDTI